MGRSPILIFVATLSIDLDIETGAAGGYFVTFATRLRELYTSGSKKYVYKRSRVEFALMVFPGIT